MHTVGCNTCFDLREINPCSQEEADTKIFLHIFDMASKQGIKKVKIRTVDTDVVVIAVSTFHCLCIDHLWIDFGTEKTENYMRFTIFIPSLVRIKQKHFCFSMLLPDVTKFHILTPFERSRHGKRGWKWIV